MKRFVLIALVLGLFCVPVFAAGNSQNISIPEKFIVAGKQLPAGDYKVTWKQMGSTMLVSLEQQNVQKPATASAPATQVEAKNGYSSYELDKSIGVATLKTLVFKKFSLVFQYEPEKGQ